MNVAESSASSDGAADDPICLLAGIELTAKQWEYLNALQEFVDSGRQIVIGPIATAAKVDRRSVARWRRDPKFLRACARIVRACNSADVELAHRANLRMALQGSSHAYELLLRRLGLYEPLPPDLAPGALQGPAAAAVASVQFIGLPAPPTPAQRDALNPPPGSAIIITAQAGRK